MSCVADEMDYEQTVQWLLMQARGFLGNQQLTLESLISTDQANEFFTHMDRLSVMTSGKQTTVGRMLDAFFLH